MSCRCCEVYGPDSRLEMCQGCKGSFLAKELMFNHCPKCYDALLDILVEELLKDYEEAAI